MQICKKAKNPTSIVILQLVIAESNGAEPDLYYSIGTQGEQFVNYKNSCFMKKYSLTRTLWHQNTPFNNDCPWRSGVRAKAGCGAIAMAQIVAYHRYPKIIDGYAYNWDAISSVINGM